MLSALWADAVDFLITDGDKLRHVPPGPRDVGTSARTTPPGKTPQDSRSTERRSGPTKDQDGKRRYAISRDGSAVAYPNDRSDQ